MLTKVKPAALELIHSMIQSCKDVRYETDLKGNRLNSNHALYTLREMLKDLSLMILEDVDDQLLNEIEFISSYIENIGKQFGHIWGNYSTGTWGVRKSEMESLVAMNNYKLPEGLDFPEYGKDSYKFQIPYGNNDIAIIAVSNIRFNWCLAIYEHKPELYTLNGDICNVHPWSSSDSWQTLYHHPDTLPFFMQYYEKHS